jgi:hypothetical protein
MGKPTSDLQAALSLITFEKQTTLCKNLFDINQE